ncbi:CBS domain-containing protein [Actibacterium sp. MT2.3-13A]|uniref:CBS domain-containing protein n=1 Tax=Actibacterium sp. MT2.3-13A TaxID=2828332 RepID=UPI001BA6058D|nr:CBS domain-containing protein [Actibacterium sp. MT2.3-13A]
MTTVKQLLDEKGPEVWSVSPDASVYDAIKMMEEKDIGAVAVVQNGQLAGIFTERHYARSVFLKGKTSPTTRVGDVMETRVVFARPGSTVAECMALMAHKRVRHLPVLEEDRLLGIVSTGDLLNSVIADQKFTIALLEDYIHGEYR